MMQASRLPMSIPNSRALVLTTPINSPEKSFCSISRRFSGRIVDILDAFVRGLRSQPNARAFLWFLALTAIYWGVNGVGVWMMVEAFYLPVSCQQCRNPACTKVCPVKATWQEPDGIVVIDYDWCIGCRCCMSACPYGARHFNWAEPGIEPEELNSETHYLGNRPRPKGVVEKCTFCIHRVRDGRYPACVEICPVGARKFGNLLDEASEMRYLMREKRVFVLKEELNTRPRFYYFYAT